MSDVAKTFLFVGVAAVAVLAAVLTQPAMFTAGPADLRGQSLFPDFKDPLAVADMEITEYDADTATWDALEVKRIERKGKLRWSQGTDGLKVHIPPTPPSKSAPRPPASWA